MAKAIKYKTFEPNWVVTPGEIISARLEDRNWTQVEFASRLNVSEKHVSQLVNAHVQINASLAQKLSNVLGSSPGYWLKLEALYQADILRAKEAEDLESKKEWLCTLPLGILRKRGFIRSTLRDVPSCMREVLQFFAVPDIDTFLVQYNYTESQGHQAFRVSQKLKSDPLALAAWMREGEIAVEGFTGPKYSSAALKDAITRLSQMTTLPAESFDETVTDVLRDAGVAFAVVPAYPKAAVSGVARFINQNLPLVLLSDYGKSMDKMWFNLFHELGHILLHLTKPKDRKTQVFLDAGSPQASDPLEDEANAFARDTLIPKEHTEALHTLINTEMIEAFAFKIGVHPGIVVGRMQHEGLAPYRAYSALKVAYG